MYFIIWHLLINSLVFLLIILYSVCLYPQLAETLPGEREKALFFFEVLLDVCLVMEKGFKYVAVCG